MKRYKKYKDSKVEWIQEIPESWTLTKLVYGFKRIGSGTTPTAGNQDYYLDGEYNWLQTGDLNDGEINSTSKKITQKALEDFSALRFYEPGSLAIAMYGATIGKTGLLNIKTVTNQACCVLAEPDSFISKYVFYWFIANKTTIISLGYGGGQPNINQEIIRSLRVPCPSKEEQIVIAHYLDKKTIQIDKLISNKKLLIELLEEERAVIINLAVTKGNNPKAKFKPSGVKWLGNIPENWNAKRLKYWINSVTGGGTPSTDTPAFWNGDIPWVSPKDMKVDLIEKTEDYITLEAIKQSTTNLVEPDHILIVVRSGILKHTLPLAVNKIPVALNQDMKAFKPNSTLLPTFLFWALKGQSKEILSQCNKLGATVDSLEMQNLMSFHLTVPSSTSEQKQIVDYLNIETQRIDLTISKIETEIELMQEYRISLISEIVTGKIKVI